MIKKEKVLKNIRAIFGGFYSILIYLLKAIRKSLSKLVINLFKYLKKHKIILLILLFVIFVLSFISQLKETQYVFLRLKIFKVKDFRILITEYKNFTEKYPNYIDPKYKLAGAYEFAYDTWPDRDYVKSQKYLELALEEYQKVLAARPNDVYVLKSMGDLYMSAEDYDKALDIYKKLSVEHPLNGVYHLKLARVYFKMRKEDLSIKEAREAVNVDPNSVEIHLGVAEIYVWLGDLPEALAEYREAIPLLKLKKKTRQLALTHYSVGRLYRRLDMRFEAANEFEIAIKLEPLLTDAYINLAEIYNMAGLSDRCIAVLNRSPISSVPSKGAFAISRNQLAGAYYLLASAYLRKGDPTASYAYLKKIESEGLKVDKNFMRYVENLVNMREAPPKKMDKAGSK